MCGAGDAVIDKNAGPGPLWDVKVEAGNSG